MTQLHFNCFPTIHNNYRHDVYFGSVCCKRYRPRSEDAVVVNSNHSLRLCGDRMKKTLLPGSHLGRNFGHYGDHFALMAP